MVASARPFAAAPGLVHASPERPVFGQVATDSSRAAHQAAASAAVHVPSIAHASSSGSNSAASLGRSDGDFARQRSSNPSRSRETGLPIRTEGGSGAALTCFMQISTTEAPVKTGVPVSK